MNLTDQNEKIRPNPFKINSNSKYGFLYFDKDKNSPIRQWKGWKSIGGETSTRFENIQELPIDIIWLTNLDKNEQWKLGKFKKIKDSTFMGVDILMLMKENIINIENNAEYCSVCSEIFSLFIDQMSFVFSKYNVSLNFQDGNAYDFIRKIMSKSDSSLDYSFEKIINMSYTDYVKIQIPYEEIKRKKVLTLSKLRSNYFEEIIKNTPYPNGNWMPIGKDKLPEDNEKKKNFIEKNNQYPMLIHIGDINIKSGNKWNISNEAFLFLGTRFDNIAKSSIWLTREEYEVIKNKINFQIKAILINDNYTNVNMEIMEDFFSKEVFFENSIIKQLMASVLFYFMSAKTRDGGNRKQFKITPKELWMKSKDNIELFNTAINFQKEGFIVSEYGNGTISILYDESININKLISLAEKNNMIIPTKLLSYGNLVKNIDFNDNRIDKKEKNIIFNQWLQYMWTKQKENNIPISLIIDRISYFLNGDEKLNKSQRIKDNLQILTSYLKTIEDSEFKTRLKELYTIQITKNIEKLKNLN